MRVSKQITRFASGLLALLASAGFLYAQVAKLPDIDGAFAKLSSTTDRDNESYFDIVRILTKLDSTTAFAYVRQLEKKLPEANDYFRMRFNLVKANVTYEFCRRACLSSIKLLLQQAVNEAYETKDLYLVAVTSENAGSLLSGCQEIELGATYLLQAAELYDTLPSKPDSLFRISIPLGEVLFHCREYEKSIFYTRKALEQWNDTSMSIGSVRARIYNTLAQNFEQLGLLDSAMYYYNVSLDHANKINDTVWRGLNIGFIGQIYFEQKKYNDAKPLLEYNYIINRDKEHAHAAKSLQFLARIDLINGRIDSALYKARESLNLLRKTNTVYLQQSAYLEMTYYTLADVYRSLEKTDSFYHYFGLYSVLHDSLQGVATSSSIRMSQLRIENDKNLRAAQELEKEKKTEELRRNFLIVGIVLLSVIVFLYLKRLRLKQRHNFEMAAQKQKTAEAELKLAKEQMDQFTENIIEKTNLIERLMGQLQHKELNLEQQKLIEEITHQTILTEVEWENFKNVFEKIYPGFIKNLKDKAMDITLAEQRMAALTRLSLTARQMASMLGISVDSVHKSRQRLRQRLQISSEINLEDSLSGL